MVEILVKFEILKGRVHGRADITLEVLARVGGEDVGLHRDIIDESLLADGTVDDLAGEDLLDVGVVVGAAIGVVSAGVPAAARQSPLTSLDQTTVGQLPLHLPLAGGLEAVGPLVSVHVPVGGEGLTTEGAGERSLAGVDQHVPVQGAEGGEHLTAEAAVVDLGLAGWVRGVWGRFDLVVTSEMTGEVFLTGHEVTADGTLVVSSLNLLRHLLVLLVHLQ